MTQEEIDALEQAFRRQGISGAQLSFAAAVIRNHVDPLRQQLQEVCNAIGSTEYMDPPDGGSVTIAEQVIHLMEERDKLHQQVTMLQDALQSRRFTDPVTDDDFLHMIDESNFAQERER